MLSGRVTGAPRTRCGRELFQHSGRDRVRHVSFEPDVVSDAPVSKVDAFQWPIWFWNQLSGVRKERLLRNLQRLAPSSAFSGYGGLELVLFMIIASLNLILPRKLPFIRALVAGDKCKSRQSVLLNMHRDHRPHHVSGDILTKLSLDAMKEVKEMIPSADSHIDAKRFAYQQIRDTVYADFKTNASSKKFDR